jgi:hypothetical protein
VQVEERALSKEKDPLSRERLEVVQKELAALEDTLRPLQLRYQQEKGRLDDIRRLQVWVGGAAAAPPGAWRACSWLRCRGAVGGA